MNTIIFHRQGARYIVDEVRPGLCRVQTLPDGHAQIPCVDKPLKGSFINPRKELDAVFGKLRMLSNMGIVRPADEREGWRINRSTPFTLIAEA